MATQPPLSSAPTGREAQRSLSLLSGPVEDDLWNDISSDLGTSPNAATSARDYQRRKNFIHSRPGLSHQISAGDQALETARRYGLTMLLDAEDRGQKQWTVQSATHPDVVYHVTVRWPRFTRGHWWDVLACTCSAEQHNLRVCWHKALVTLHWRAIRNANGRPTK